MDRIKLTSKINSCLANEPTMRSFNLKREFRIMLQFLTRTSRTKAISFLGVIDVDSKFSINLCIFIILFSIFRFIIKYTLILWFSVFAILKANSVHEFIPVPQYPQKESVDAFIAGWWFWFALLPPVNLWLTLVLGRYFLAMTLFPY